VAYEEHDIVDASDLMTLPQTGEAILITPYGYSRIQKVPWYKDGLLRVKAEKIIKTNETINSNLIERKKL
jgi:hypothetical protein